MEPIGIRISPTSMSPAESVSDLTDVPATMLITLAAKVLAATEAPDLQYAAHRSQEILRQLEIDPRRFNLNAKEVRAVVLRSQWFGQTVRRFLEGHPDGLCINLGCGLDPSFEELEAAGDSRFAWVDVDLPEVIAIRRQFFAESAHRRIVAGDITDSHLFATLPWETGRPAIVVAEGVLYFLQRAQVEALFLAQAEADDARTSKSLSTTRVRSAPGSSPCVPPIDNSARPSRGRCTIHAKYGASIRDSKSSRIRTSS
jgi:O-methyltransferase involved in polyketide biosynthesis